MTPSPRAARILEALTRADALLRAGEGNPHHDAEGKFTSAGGEGSAHHGPGKHHARNKRRRLRKLRHRIRRKQAALKARHESERRDLASRQRARHAAHRAHYDARMAKAKARKQVALEKADARHEREIGAMERRRERERSREGNASPEDVAKWEARHRKDIDSAREYYRKVERPAKERMHEFDVGAVRHEREQAAAELKDRHSRQRRGMLKRQREERAEFHGRAREAWQRHGGKIKAKVEAKGHPGGADRAMGPPPGGVDLSLGGIRPAGPDDPALRDAPGRASISRRLGPHRTHKAGSAESIYRHAFRIAGIPFRRRGELTDRERLDLLAAVREYGRAWLRHEAEQLLRFHGGTGDGGQGHLAGRGHPGAGRRGDGGMGHVPADLSDPADELRSDPGASFPAASASAEGVSDGSRAGERSADADGPGPDRDRTPLRDGGGRGILGDGDPADAAPPMGEFAGEVARALAAGMRGPVARFFRRVRGFLHELITAGAMALSGPGPLSGEDVAEIDRQHAAQVSFLEAFERDVTLRTPPEIAEPSGLALVQPITAAQFIARAESYAGSTWVANVNHDRNRTIRQGYFDEERRVHSKPLSDHGACATCKAESDKGWQPLGSLAPLGDSECLGINCDCHFIYRKRKAA